MNVKIEKRGKKNILVIELECNDVPIESGSGKNLIVASSGGNQRTTVEVEGKQLTVGVNAYIRK